MTYIPNLNNALNSDIRDWKNGLVEAINNKGGYAEPNSSFNQLIEDVQTIPEVNSNGWVFKDNYKPSNLWDLINSIINVVSIQNDSVQLINKNSLFSYCESLTTVDLPALTTISGNHTFSYSKSLGSFDLPALTTISGYGTFSNCESLTTIVLGELERLEGYTFSGSPRIRNISVGNNTNINIDFRTWYPTEVIAEGQSGIEELNNNLYNYLLTKLYDHSGDGETRTLELGWLEYVTQENIDYATAKGWTLTN